MPDRRFTLRKHQSFFIQFSNPREYARTRTSLVIILYVNSHPTPNFAKIKVDLLKFRLDIIDNRWYNSSCKVTFFNGFFGSGRHPARNRVFFILYAILSDDLRFHKPRHTVNVVNEDFLDSTNRLLDKVKLRKLTDEPYNLRPLTLPETEMFTHVVVAVPRLAVFGRP